MKNPNKHNLPKGFTLIELLVVVAIIAVLAAAGFAGGRAAMNKARKVTAQAVATSIAANIESFYSDYSALPEPSSGGDDDTIYDTTSTAGLEILNILAAQETGTTTVQNNRKVRYLTVKEAKGSGNNLRDGATYDADGKLTGLYDPWGEPYYFQIDYDYNEVLAVTPQGSVPAKTLRGKRSAVWSLGVEDGAEADDDAEADSSTIAKTW